MENYQIDNLDGQIINALQKDARLAFTDLAQKLKVSHGTIHQRVQRLMDLKIIKGTKIVIDYQKLGMDVTTLLGIHLKTAKDQAKVVEKLKAMPEVIEIYYTTGTYALIIKIINKNIKDFHMFLSEKLQGISEIQSTESFLCLDVPLERSLEISSMQTNQKLHKSKRPL